jgi:hypothetical protein
VTAAALAAAARPSIAADDDVVLAKALVQRGYPDVAERVLRRAAEGSATSPRRRSESRLALAQLRRFDVLRAARTRGSGRLPAATVQQMFETAETGYRALLSDALVSRTARTDLARLLTSHAEFHAAAGARDSCVKLLDEALQLVADALTTASGDDEIAPLRLLRIQALETKGAALGADDRAGADALNAALDDIEKFTWDYAGTLRCAWAFRWKGLVLARMGRSREACESLRDAATSVSERDAVRGADEMALSAYEDLARVALEAGTPDAKALADEAMVVLERLTADWPHHCATPAGRRARLAAARLHEKAGRRADAVADARAVLEAAGDDDPDAAEDACALLAEWTASAGSAAHLGPELNSRMMRIAARGADLGRTVDACRAVIAACDTPESRDRWAWDAWETMGRAYGAAGRWYEAYVAFERIEDAWRGDPSNPRLAELTDSTAYWRADALAQLSVQTKDAKDRTAADRAMSEFARDHPGSSFASGAREQRAFRALAEAAAIRRSGDAAAATSRCREALAALSEIGEDSAMFDRAQALVAEAHRQLGETAEAVRLAEAWLAQKRPDPATPGAKRSRAVGRVQALTTLVMAKADAAAAAEGAASRAAASRELLDTLSRCEADYLGLNPKGRDQFDAWRAEALLGAGDAEAAEPLILRQIEVRPSHPGTRYLAAGAARADDDAAAAAKDPARSRELSLRAARLWDFVLESAHAPDPDVARSAGLAFRAGGDLVHAADLLSLAASLSRAAAEKATDPAERAALSDTARAVSLELTRTLVAARRFEDAESEVAAILVRDDAESGAVLVKLSDGEQLREADVQWLLRRAARNRAAVDALADAYLGAGTRERLNAAAQTLAALRLTLPRDQAPTAESVGLALRHADALARLAAAGGRHDAALSAASCLDDAFGSDEAMANAESLLPGARARVAALRARLKEIEDKR